jgi:hypothetical protein
MTEVKEKQLKKSGVKSGTAIRGKHKSAFGSFCRKWQSITVDDRGVRMEPSAEKQTPPSVESRRDPKSKYLLWFRLRLTDGARELPLPLMDEFWQGTLSTF